MIVQENHAGGAQGSIADCFEHESKPNNNLMRKRFQLWGSLCASSNRHKVSDCLVLSAFCYRVLWFDHQATTQRNPLKRLTFTKTWHFRCLQISLILKMNSSQATFNMCINIAKRVVFNSLGIQCSGFCYTAIWFCSLLVWQASKVYWENSLEEIQITEGLQVIIHLS